MSRTVAFGRDLLGASDVDIEDLLACLSPAEVQALLDELAGDPDDNMYRRVSGIRTDAKRIQQETWTDCLLSPI